MLRLILGGSLAVLTAGMADAGDPPSIQIEAPREWRAETIELPPGFAPDMKLKGVEEIRFAPGMLQADSDSFFSYFLVFALPEQKSLDEETLQRELLVYYRGLASAVAGGKNVEIDVDKFTLELEKVKPEDADDAPREWTGTLKWVEPFVTVKAQTLRFDIQTGTLEGGEGVYITMCASPADREADIWQELHSVRETVEFRE